MNPSKILSIWEQCSQKNNLQAGILMTSLVSNANNFNEIANWSIEKRDAHLFYLRKLLFGTVFENIDKCSNCGELVEWTANYEQLNIPNYKTVTDKKKVLEINNHTIEYQLPTTRDIATNNVDDILSNCIQSCTKNGHTIDSKDIPKRIKQNLISELEKESHVSNISVLLNCQECKHHWESTFDIVPYLKAELDQWAKRFLNQVAVLAKGFGWSETSIINMSQIRRNHYLNLLYS